jgi:anthranilate synthase/aminodeoxychorismate synthase-like glutamine amidotransferase
LILLLDNFDSFTFNLVDYFHQLKISCEVQRNDVEVEEIIKKKYNAIVLCPGPGNPNSAGNLMKIIEYYHDKLPILGICLGHQAIGQYFGAKIKKAILPMHGKISEMLCKKDDIFKNIPAQINVVRYHSLILEDLPTTIDSIGSSKEGEIMAIKHNKFPIYGLQYHPEAFLTEYGKEILNNWIFLHKITD